MITRHDAERLAKSIHALRPDWPEQQLMTLIGELRSWPLIDLTVGMAYVAQEQTIDGAPVSKTPYRVKEQGPWRHVGTVDPDAEQQRQRAERERQERLDAASARAKTRQQCQDCDERGYLPNGAPCPHDVQYRREAAARWAAKARDALSEAAKARELSRGQ